MDTAIKEFKKKYNDKTRNNWDERADFNPVPGKYTLIEMEAGEEEDMEEMQAKVNG